MLRDRDKRLDEHERDISLLRDILSDQISKGELLRMHMENAGKFDTIFRLLEKGADKHTQDYEHLFTLMNTLPKRKGDAE